MSEYSRYTGSGSSWSRCVSSRFDQHILFFVEKNNLDYCEAGWIVTFAMLFRLGTQTLILINTIANPQHDQEFSKFKSMPPIFSIPSIVAMLNLAIKLIMQIALR